MRKFLRSFVMMALLAVPFIAQAQNTLTVADGTTTNSYVPVYGLWADDYLRCQIVYPASEIENAADVAFMTGGSITSMTFHASTASASWTGTFEVKLMEISGTTISSFQNVASATTVYTGTLAIASNQLVVNFTTPYTYQGGNLLVEVSETTPGNYVSSSFYGVTYSGVSLANYNSSGVSSVSATQRDFLPKTTFTFTGGTPLTCPAVTNLAVSNITPTSATLTWTDDINTGATYTIKNGNEVIASGVTGTTYDLPGLTANTAYTFGVMANCSATDNSNTKTVSFTTPCSYESMPYAESFDANLSSNACWGGATGITAAEVFNGSTLNIGAISGWSYQSAVSNGIPAGHYRVNIYGSSCKYWMITPNIDLTSAASAQLTFDAAFTAYSGTALPSGYTSNSSQAFMVLISTDGGQTWLESNATKWQNAGGDYTLESLASLDYIEQTINLNQYLGQTIRIAFYAQSTTSGGDNNLHIDNIVVDVVPTCFKVTNLAVSNITDVTATLTWTDAINTGASYTIYNGDEVVATVPAGTYTYDITGLTALTNYEFSVVANCAADDASRAVSVTFTSGCPEYISLPYVTSFENDPYYSAVAYAAAFPYCWNRINDATGTYNYYPYNGNSTSSAHTGAHYLYFYGATGAAYATNQMAVMPEVDVTVNPMNNNMVQFWAKRSTNASSVEVGTMSDPTDMSTFTVAQEVELTTTYTQYRVKFTNAPATDAYVAFRLVKGSSAKYVYLDDVTLDTIPAVWPVVAAQVDSVTDGSISLSWTANPENDAVTYTIYDGATAVATGITETHTTITGLTANTSYTFAVVAVAGNKESTPVEVEGRTDCDYNLVLSLPVSMGFEDAEMNDLYCWSAIYGSADNASANPMVRAILDGDTVWRFSSYSSASDYNQYLVSPRFTTTTPVKVTFNHVNAGYESDQIQVVYFMPNAAGDGDTIIEATDWMSAFDMTTDSAYLPAEATRVGFHYYGNYAYYYYIDNINLSVAPTHNVTFNYINQEGNSEVWGSAAVDGLAYEGVNATLVSTPGEYKRTAAWYAGNITDTTGHTALAIDTNTISFGPVMGDTAVTVFYGYGQFRIAAAPNQERMGEVVADPVSANNMYDYQSEVTLTPVAADGFMFKEWLNAEDHSFFSNDNPLTLTATQNYNLTARFVIDTFAITIVTENGTVEGADQGYMFGEVATITAVPDEHYEFYYWADTVDGVSIAADPTLSFRMLSDTTFYPVFGPLQYTVTIDGDPTRATYVIKHGDVENTTGAGDYTYGDTLTVIARAINSNYDWMGWKVGDETVTTDTAYTFVLEDNITFFANIPGGMYTMTFATNDMDMGSVAIDSVRLEDGTVVDYTDSTTLTVTLNYGSIIYATATPVSQYAQFNGWSHGTADLMALSAAFNVVNDTTVYANFGFQTYNVTVNIYPDVLVADNIDINPAAPEYGESVTLTATAAAHWVFDRWEDAEGNVIGTDVAYTSGLLFEDMTYNVYFVRDTHTVVALVEDETYGTTEVTNADAEVAAQFVHGSAATFTFTPGYGYNFAAWVDEDNNVVSNDNPYTIDEVEEDITLTATVDPIIYHVNVYSGEAQRGSASTTTPEVPYLEYATLGFTPEYGYVFLNWSDEAGNVLSEDENYSPQVLRDTTIVAHFDSALFTISAVVGSPDEAQPMMGAVTGTGTYKYLSVNTLHAEANYGFNFSKWVDAAGNELGTSEDIDIILTCDTTVYAVFDYEPMDVVINVNDPLFGTAAVTSAAAPYFFSQTITIEATPAEHYHFNEWVDGDGNTVSTDNPYTFILTEPVNYTAIFAIDTHTVTLVYNENAVEEIHGAGEYIYGSDVEVGLTPAYGFTFTGWDNGETTNPFTLHVESDTTVEAIFTTNQYTVTAEVAAASTGMGTAGGTNTVDYMSYVILTATPATGHDFVNWTNADGEVASTDLSFYVQATQDTTFYANFKVHAYTVTIASADEERGDVTWSAPTHIETVTDQTSDFANGTNTNNYVPVYGTWADAYLRAQMVYPAEMLSDINTASISSMTFYLSSPASAAWTGTFQVKVKEYESATLTSFVDMTSATTVYTGNLDATSSTMTINFNSPVVYNGGNLLIEVAQTVKGNYKSASFYGVTTTGASVQGYNSSSLTSISATQRNFLPKVTFTYDIDQVVLDPIAGVTYDDNDPDHIAYVDYQSSIAMEATAEYGYHFENWSNSLDATTSTDNPMTVASIEADVDYTANFGKNQYTITAAVGGDMAGAVAGTATVDYLETVTLTATPNADHRLLRWVNANNDVLGTSETITITAERDSVITAIFGYQVYTLTANTEDFEMGGVYVEDPAGAGTPLPITIDFESGAMPTGWTNEGDATWTVGTGDYSTSTGAHAGTYNAKITHTSSGNSTMLVSPVMNFSTYSNVSLNYWFVNRSWAGDIDEFNVYYRTSATDAWHSLATNSSANSTWTEANHNLPNLSATYQVAFEMYDNYGYGAGLDDIEFITTDVPGAMPSLESSYVDVDYTTNVNVYATPAEHYHFVGWMNEAGDTVTALGVNANPTITVLGDSTLTALFDGDQMPMTYQVNSTVRGSVEGPASGEYNTEVTFEAIAAHGYEFDRWEDGFEDNPRTVTVLGTDAENTYKAIFSFQTFDVDVAVENGTLADELDTREIYYGTQLTIEAVADEHYSNWKGWKDADGNVVTTENPYTFLVLEDVVLTGVFEIDSVDYTFASNDNTMGTVASSIDAGRYAYNTEVTLTATIADADHHFVNWNDGSEETERTIVLTQDTDLVANFALNMYNVAANATNGTVEWAGYDYAYPTVNITIDGQDSYGDGWTGWSGATYINIVQNGSVVYAFTLPSSTTSDSYSTSLTADEPITFEWVSGSYDDETSFTITVDGEVVATVADGSTLTDGQVIYTIAAGTPAITAVVPVGTTPVAPHTDLTFTATPDAGYEFVNWTSVDGDIISSANPVIINVNSDTTLVANFSTEVYTVVAISSDTVKGTVSPATANLTVEQGALLTATAKYGYVFENWTNKNGVEISTDAEFTFTDVTMDTVYANFNYDFFDITVATNNATYGSVMLDGNATVLTKTYPYGDTANLTAVANAGYVFVRWDDGLTAASRRVIVEATTTYTAIFADNTPITITATVDDAVHGTATVSGDNNGIFLAGDVATITAIEFPNYFFTNWQDGNTDNPRQVDVTQDSAFVAYFDTIAFTVTIDGTAESVKYGATYTTATVTPAACQSFAGWSDGTTVVSTENPYTFTVTGDITLTSTFEAAALAGEETQVACGSYEWHGQTYTATGDYTWTDASNCDSVATLHLTINTAAAGTNTAAAICEGATYTWNNTDYSTADTYYYNYTDANGCNVQDTLVLTVNTPAAGTTTAEAICAGATYTWNTIPYSVAGTYTNATTDANGCTVVDTLVLTVNQPSNETITVSACGSYTWNGETYNASGLYDTTFTNAAGCDSVVTLALTINQPVYTTINQTACDSYEWNNEVLTVSGNYYDTLTAANSCDSIITLALVINNAVTDTVTAEACGSYLWNGTEYTAAGEYTWTGVAANGCDSIVTLVLTIAPGTTGVDTAEACGSYTWNGVTYDASGEYTWTGTAANGCDSVVTLTLTITPAATGVDTAEACDSYLWNGVTYTASGDYTWTGTAANGCDSVVTLTLTINQSASTTVTETVEDNIVWNGVTYTESGTYTWTGVAANGCDSVVTLVLTVTVPDTNYYTVSILTDNPGMGTLTGAGTYAEGSIVTLTATPNAGYEFVMWMVGDDTACTTPEYTFTLVSDTTVTAVFAALPVYYTVTGVANDSTMGYVLGSSDHCLAGSTVTLTAQANQGYHFVRWSNGHAEPTISFTVTGDITLTAEFAADEPVTGIEEGDMENVTIYSAESTIIVRGAEGKDVNVYDINGRTISRKVNAGETVEFRMAATGVYLVKVGNAPAKRVLVVR